MIADSRQPDSSERPAQCPSCGSRLRWTRLRGRWHCSCGYDTAQPGGSGAGSTWSAALVRGWAKDHIVRQATPMVFMTDQAIADLATRFDHESERLRADLDRVTAELQTTELVFHNLQVRCDEVEMRHGDLLRANAALKAERDAMREVATFLFDRLDDIDTLYDACKGDEHAFYVQVARVHLRRFEVATTDGYTVTFKIDATRKATADATEEGK